MITSIQSPATRAVLIIPVPEADAATSSWRERYTLAGKYGMPPHITLWEPYDAPNGVSDATIQAIKGALAATKPIAFTLLNTGNFNNEVLFLQPDKREQLADVIRAAQGAEPGHTMPPTMIHPHVTVAMKKYGADIPAIQRAVNQLLPVSVTATEAWLMIRPAAGSNWQLRAKIPLAG